MASIGQSRTTQPGDPGNVSGARRESWRPITYHRSTQHNDDVVSAVRWDRYAGNDTPGRRENKDRTAAHAALSAINHGGI